MVVGLVWSVWFLGFFGLVGLVWSVWLVGFFLGGGVLKKETKKPKWSVWFGFFWGVLVDFLVFLGFLVSWFFGSP